MATIDYLLVAGGGAGGARGNRGGGGGGAGGVKSATGFTIVTGTYPVVIGAGGTGNSGGDGNNGANSTFAGNTAVGGGGGGSDVTGNNGGSGGGVAGIASGGTVGTGTAGQGNNGGGGGNNGTNYGGGGGGGASAVGANGTSSQGGVGGAGVASSISGSSVTYAGGGGAGTGNQAGGPGPTAGAGGAGGGGAGNNLAGGSDNGTAGTPNTGGGGGGANGGTGGAGGSGICIISYPTDGSSGIATATGGTITTSGLRTIHTFTSSGDFVMATEFAPTVTTQAVSGIGILEATGNGNVTSDGGAVITERGMVWSLTPTPTTSNFKGTASGTTGAFTVLMEDLVAGTTYYVRAYAINSIGTSYGSEVSFTTDTVADNTIVKNIDGVTGQTYAVQLYIGGSVGTVTVQLGTTGASQTFNAGAGTVTLQGLYGGLNGLIITSNSFNGYIEDVYWVLVLGDATINWSLATLTNIFPINSSVVFKRIEDKDFNKFRIYRYLEVQFKDQDAYITVVLKKEANEDLVEASREFLVSNTSDEVLPFINKKLSVLIKNQAIRIGFSNNRLSETFSICQFILKGTENASNTFDSGKIISIGG